MNTTNHNTRGLLAELRALRPNRHLSPSEARSVAERQAALLLKRTGADTPVNLDLLDGLTRLRVRRDRGLPDMVAGSSHWTGAEWLICLNLNHPEQRQRFTAFHELFHVIEHSVRRFESSATAEVLADHFAACVLMPRPSVKQAWGNGIQDINELAEVFAVSEQAMRVRLVKLGLIDGTRHDCRRPRRIYFRLSIPTATPSAGPIPLRVANLGGRS